MKFSLKYISWQSIFLLVIYFVLYIELDYVLGLILLHYKILLYVTRLQIRFLKLLRYLKPLCCFSINILKTFLKGIAIFSSLQSYLSVNCTKKFFFKFNIGYWYIRWAPNYILWALKLQKMSNLGLDIIEKLSLRLN